MGTDEKKFETARTRELRTRELDEREQRAVGHVEQFGCHVIQVRGDGAGPAWTYTLGITDTCGKPEIITVGLKDETALRAVNYAADALRSGIDLTVGRHREIVGQVEVIFRTVDPKWVRELMGWAKWFNGGWDFPVLQLIYPDLENRFQWEEGFTEYFRQPLLQADAPQTDVEYDFKASLDPESSLSDWKFPDGPHTRAFLSKMVTDGDEAVTYVSHDLSDGAWQFLGNSMSDGGGPVIECLHHPIDRDPTLNELADLPLGWYAEREAVGAPWIRREHEPDEVEG
jgi:hypothetical protein